MRRCGGLVPGCPASTPWLALLMLCWRDPVPVERLYALVARAEGPRDAGVVGPMWGVTGAFGRAAGLVPNPGECVRLVRARGALRSGR